MPDKLLQNDVIKLLTPAFIAVAVKVAIEMKKNNTRMSFFNICLSMVIGVGGAWISSGILQKTFGPDYIYLAVAVVAIMTEKIGEFLIYKFNVDIFMNAVVNGLFDYINGLRQAKK